MAFSFKKFWKGIRLVPNASSTSDAKGDLQVTDSDSRLTYHNGTSVVPVVTTTSPDQGSVRLKNKDLDDATTLIVDTSDTTKQIAFDAGGTTGTKSTITGAQTANRVLTLPDATDTLAGISATQTLTNKTLTDSTTFVQDESDNTKKMQFQISGVTTGTTRTLTVPDANTTIVGTDATQTLTNKTITISDSNLTIQDNGDATKQLKFEASGISTGTTRTLTAPNASTTIVGTDATQTLSNKSFSDAVTLPEIATPSTPSSGNGKVYFKSDGFLYQLNDDGTETKVGAGSGGINYIANPDAESSTSGWATYADTAANIPADGTGGTATGLTFSASSSSPLRGTKSFLMVQDNSTSLQGKGVSYDFTINSADQANVLNISFDFNASSTFVTSNGITAPLNDGTTTTNAGNSDIEVFIYDVTNSQLIIPTPQVITAKGSNNFSYKSTFQSNSTSISYRLILHVATTSANATGWQFKFDNVVVGPEISLYGAPISDWTRFTPTGSWSTNTNYDGYYRRVGDSLEVYGLLATTGAPTSATLTVNLPTGFIIDTTRILSSGSPNDFTFGIGSITDNSGITYYPAQSRYSSTTAVQFVALDPGANSYSPITQAFPMTWAASDTFYFRFLVPVSGWGSSVLMSNDTDTRVVAARVGGNPASASANAPIIFPTVSFDTHSSYSVSTGLYTVPVSGTYQVSVILEGDVAGTNISLYKNASAECIIANSSATYMFAVGSALVKCIAGDTLSVRPAATWDATAQSTMHIERLSGPSAIAATETIAANYTTNAGQAISTGSATIVDFEDKNFDTHSSVTVGASWKFTAPASGKYRLSSNIEFAADTDWTATETLYLEIYKNGSFYSRIDFRTVEVTATSIHALSGSNTVSMIAGDYIDVRVTQNSGGSVSLNSVTGLNNISIERFGN